MPDDHWLTLRKGITHLYVEWGHAHGKVFATDCRMLKGPPVTIALSLDKNFRARSTGSGTYIDAKALAEGGLREVRLVQISDQHILSGIRIYLPEPTPEIVRPVAAFAFVTGWRVSEVLGLTWDRVDFDAQMVRLETGSTKNYEGRQFPFTPDLFAILDAQREATEAASVRLERIIPTVFHRDGAPIKSFRHSWDSACKAAGVPGRILHDFRRTAVRNLERAGVSRSVAMKLTGHKTEAVYRRYAIVSDSDLRAAAVKLAAASDQPRSPRIAALHSV